ncbi:hypothetical protein AWB71_00487 [Caballeronia peredens]|nr:hypothetical protein AWB71_00487 [Caballeronia peredens]
MTTWCGRLTSASLVVLLSGCPAKQAEQPAQTQAASSSPSASAPAPASPAVPASVAAPASAAAPASLAAVPPSPISSAQLPAGQYPPEELEALVAPIALYPDSLLSQVLMASTYPLEIVHAARWAKSHPDLKGDAAVKAVQDQPWDVSVKSLVAFPQVLVPMNDKLDWTQRLGDAFLAQEKDVLDAVQRLRIRAQDAGHLASNAQQRVVVEPRAAAQPGQPAQPAQSGQAAPASQTIVRIEPANPQVIYVPSYNPTVVYGAWPAPAYPPTYWPPAPAYYPGAALASGFAWGLGIAAAGAIFSDCNWNSSDVNVNVNRATNIDRNFDRTKVEGGKWQHDARHRQGVAYRDNATRDKYSRGVQGADARRDYRGRSGTAPDRANVANRAAPGNQGAANRQARANNANVANRAGSNNPKAANRAGANHGGAGNRPNASDRQAAPNRAQASNRNAAAGNRPQTSGLPAHAPGRAQQPARNAPAGAHAGDRGGYGGRGHDTAFQGVGGGGAAQRDFNRGHSSVQSSQFNRGGGGARGGGGGRGGGRR